MYVCMYQNELHRSSCGCLLGPPTFNPSTYQQVAGILELGFVQHPTIAQIFQLIGGVPCWPDTEQVLKEMLAFWDSSLQLLKVKAPSCHDFPVAQEPLLAGKDLPIKYHQRHAGKCGQDW